MRMKSGGFTIVELAAVIFILGILATITIMSYSSWQSGIQDKEVRSDLGQAATAMKSARNFSTTGYPSSLPTSFIASTRITISNFISTATTYCIEAHPSANAENKYHITESSGGVVKGSCAGLELQVPLIDEATITSGRFINMYFSSNNASTYDIQQKIGNGAWLDYLSTPSNRVDGLQEVDDIGTYSYRVRAVNASATKSNWSEAVTFTVVSAPSKIVYCTSRYGQVDYRWTVSGSAVPITTYNARVTIIQQSGAIDVERQFEADELSNISGTRKYSSQNIGEQDQYDTMQSFYGMSADQRTVTLPQTPPITGSNVIDSCNG